MKLYEKHGRFIPLSTKRIPIWKGWRDRNFAWGEARRRLSQNGNVGFVIPENMIVIDVDPRNGGLESYEKLLDVSGMADLCFIYPSVISGGNGLHIYAKIKRSHEKIAPHSPDYPGIDIKKYGGYVVTAGSNHSSGRKYEVYNDLYPVPLMYDGVLDLFVRRVPKARKSSVPAEWTNDQLAAHLALLNVEFYDSDETWYPILAAAHTATGGNGLDVFLEWSLADPKYADAEEQIRARWDSLHEVTNPRTAATICAEIDPADLRELQTTSSADLFDDIPDENKTPLKSPSVLPDQDELDEKDQYGGYDDDADLPHQIARAVLREKILISASDGRFWEYKKTHWKPIGSNLVSNYIYHAYAAMGSSKSLSTVMSATLGVINAITAKDWTPGAAIKEGYSVINVQNGEVWIDDKTGDAVLCPHDPESSQVSCLPILYKPAATAPRFEKFLDEIFAKNHPIERARIIRHLIEVLGYTIQARKNIATWVLFHGRGANGKTVLLSILSALLGDAALERPIGAISTERNNHALASLPGKLAIIDDDVSYSTVLPDGEIKSLSENKWLEANPKNATPYRFRSCVIPILSANSYPSTKDLSDGLKRRAQVFRFKRVFTPEKQDTTLTDYIVVNELPGVLNLLLDGLKRLRKRGNFDPPKTCLKARETWYSSNNMVVTYVRGRLIRLDVEAPPIPFKVFWADYLEYCVEEGIRKTMSRSQFRYALEASGILVASRSGSIVVIGHKPKGYTG